MLDPNNPLAVGDIDDEVDNTTGYGVDVDGPSPFEISDNVVVDPLQTDFDQELIKNMVYAHIDPLKESTEMGVNLFKDSLDLIYGHLGILWLKIFQVGTS